MFKVESIDESGWWEDASAERFDTIEAAIAEALNWWPEAQTRIIDVENQRAVWENGERK